MTLLPGYSARARRAGAEPGLGSPASAAAVTGITSAGLMASLIANARATP